MERAADWYKIYFSPFLFIQQSTFNKVYIFSNLYLTICISCFYCTKSQEEMLHFLLVSIHLTAGITLQNMILQTKHDRFIEYDAPEYEAS